MSIRRVSWAAFRLPFAGAFATAHGSVAVREGVLLRLLADDGLAGLGEASPVPAFGGGTAADAHHAIAALAPSLVDRDLVEANRRLATLDLARPGVAAAACALDTALCDLRARAAGISVAELLGGNPARNVPVNATIGALEPESAAVAAAQAVAAGFSCIKLKVGVAGSVPAELDRIAAVRAAIGCGTRLRLDANGAWGAARAIAIIQAAEVHDLELVEQPVPADDLAGMARVRAAVRTPIAADESAGRLDQARRVIAAGAADVLVVKPMVAGGLRAGQQILELARAAGLQAFVTTTIDAGIGVAAALQLATLLPEPALACGLATGPLLAGDLIARPLDVQAGVMPLPARPGLGVTLDDKQLARYGGVWQDVGK